MSKSTISTFQLFERFPDQESARLYFEKRLWPNGVVCPVCGLGERITARKAGYYRCNQCSEDFTVRTNTVMERSHIPLHKWLYAMYLLVTARKGISSLQLAKEIGITQKSAWFLLHRLREACGKDLRKLQGIVEIDETYVGGKERNKHKDKKLNLGRGPVGKTAVLGMRERGGRMKAMTLEDTSSEAIRHAIYSNIELGSHLHTDEAPVYADMDGLFYRHDAINHGLRQYRRKDVTTNGIESAFAVLKRGIVGVYHHITPKHTGRYVDEFAFRLNDGNVKRHTLDRLDSFVDGMAQKRLTYKRLINLRRLYDPRIYQTPQWARRATCLRGSPNEIAHVSRLDGVRVAMADYGEPMTPPKVPKQLDAIADVVLAYRPKPKSKPAKKRKRKRRKLEKEKADE